MLYVSQMFLRQLRSYSACKKVSGNFYRMYVVALIISPMHLWIQLFVTLQDWQSEVQVLSVTNSPLVRPNKESRDCGQVMILRWYFEKYVKLQRDLVQLIWIYVVYRIERNALYVVAAFHQMKLFCMQACVVKGLPFYHVIIYILFHNILSVLKLCLLVM